ncbi:MAG: hypothetical protein MI867_20820 [Pseudomonadales bacterium]|nr:hypothetical protein [Pseudomonadales bacterium]
MEALIILCLVLAQAIISNTISKVSRGDVVLSVSLTAVVSLLSFVTVPFFIMWSMHHFLGEESVSISVTDLALITFLITITPVSVG